MRVVVVGGGVIGLSAAHRLARRGAVVHVIETGRPNASLAAAGMLPPALEAFEADGAHPDLPALLGAGAMRWPEFVREIAGEGAEAALGYRKLGTIVAAPQARLMQMAQGAAAMGACVEILDRAGALRLEPHLGANVQAALHFPDDALVEPPLVIAALRAALIQAGCTFQLGRVSAVEPLNGGVSVRLAEGRSIIGDAVLLATGWTQGPFLAPELAQLFPVKGQILTIAGKTFAPRRMLRGGGVYLAPRGDGRVDIGATSERDRDDLNIDPDAILTLRRLAEALYPALASAPAIASRVGVRPDTADHAPLLGRSTSSDAIYLAAGTYRNGVLLAPLIADILADAILGARGESQSALFLRRFSAQRFTR